MRVNYLLAPPPTITTIAGIRRLSVIICHRFSPTSTIRFRFLLLFVITIVHRCLSSLSAAVCCRRLPLPLPPSQPSVPTVHCHLPACLLHHLMPSPFAAAAAAAIVVLASAPSAAVTAFAFLTCTFHSYPLPFSCSSCRV